MLIVDLASRLGMVNDVVFGAHGVKHVAGVRDGLLEGCVTVEFELAVFEISVVVFGSTEFWKSRLGVIQVMVLAHSQHIVGREMRLPAVLRFVFAAGLTRYYVELPTLHSIKYNLK